MRLLLKNSAQVYIRSRNDNDLTGTYVDGFVAGPVAIKFHLVNPLFPSGSSSTTRAVIGCTKPAEVERGISYGVRLPSDPQRIVADGGGCPRYHDLTPVFAGYTPGHDGAESISIRSGLALV